MFSCKYNILLIIIIVSICKISFYSEQRKNNDDHIGRRKNEIRRFQRMENIYVTFKLMIQ